MKFLKVKDDNGLIHNISASKVIDFIELNELSTKLILDFPLYELTFEVFWNADDLIEEIYGTDDTDDVYDVIDCIPHPPTDLSALLADTAEPNIIEKDFEPLNEFEAYLSKKKPKRQKGKKRRKK